MRPVLVFSLFLPLWLSACARDPASATTVAPPAHPPAAAAPHPAAGAEMQVDALRVQWQCGDGAVQAELDAARERMALLVDGRTLRMHRVDADSGARYTDALGNVFWEHPQDAATLTLSGQRETRKCVRQGSGVSG